MAVQPVPADLSSELDQANDTVRTEPAKAEELYQSILSRKAGQRLLSHLWNHH